MYYYDKVCFSNYREDKEIVSSKKNLNIPWTDANSFIISSSIDKDFKNWKKFLDRKKVHYRIVRCQKREEADKKAKNFPEYLYMILTKEPEANLTPKSSSWYDDIVQPLVFSRLF